MVYETIIARKDYELINFRIACNTTLTYLKKSPLKQVFFKEF